jgi:type VI secretion system secreted protein Hcp
MSIIAYLTLTGAKQGAIKGGVTAKGREGTIAVAAVSHEITTPVDQATGAATGKRSMTRSPSPW